MRIKQVEMDKVMKDLSPGIADVVKEQPKPTEMNDNEEKNDAPQT